MRWRRSRLASASGVPISHVSATFEASTWEYLRAFDVQPLILHIIRDCQRCSAEFTPTYKRREGQALDHRARDYSRRKRSICPRTVVRLHGVPGVNAETLCVSAPNLAGERQVNMRDADRPPATTGITASSDAGTAYGRLALYSLDDVWCCPKRRLTNNALPC